MKRLLSQFKLISILITLIATITFAQQQLVTGFLPVYRTLPADYDFSRLTHLIYFSLIPGGDGTFSWTSGRDSVSMYNTFQNLRTRIGDGDTKLILSIGGTDAVGSGGYNTIAADQATRELFVSRIKSILTEWGADGVDIDWEKWLKTKEDSDSHEAFLKALSDTLHPEGFEIFTDVSASNWNGQWINDGALDYVDYVQPMSYTFSGNWSKTTVHNSSFSQSVGAMEYWVGRGVPKEKLVMGVPFYGIGFGGADGVGQEFAGAGPLGQFVDYPNVLTALESGNYTHSEPNDPSGPYIYRSDASKEIVFYNDTAIMAKKANFVIDEGYAGVMIWELGQDQEGDMSLLDVLAKTMHGTDDEGGSVAMVNQINRKEFSSMKLVGRELHLGSLSNSVISLSIFDLQGRELISVNEADITKTGTISLTALSKGVYLAKFGTLSGTVSATSIVIQ